jgi:hypothetical protein
MEAHLQDLLLEIDWKEEGYIERWKLAEEPRQNLSCGVVLQRSAREREQQLRVLGFYIEINKELETHTTDAMSNSLQANRTLMVIT